MKNVTTTVAGTKLTIVIDLSKDHGPSASGKSLTVASSEGAQDVGGGIKLNLNVYKSNPGYVKPAKA